MHLGGSGRAQKVDNSLAGGAADNGIIHHDDPLSRHLTAQGTQLDAHGGLTVGLVRGDEGAADIAVLHKAVAKGIPDSCA